MIKHLPVFILLMVFFTAAKAQTQADSTAKDHPAADTIVKHKAARAFIKYQLDDTTAKQTVPVPLAKTPVMVKPTADTAVKKRIADSVAKNTAIPKSAADSIMKKSPAGTLVKSTAVAKPMIDSVAKVPPPTSGAELIKPATDKKGIKHLAVEKAAPLITVKHSPVKTISDYRYNAYLKGDDLDSMALAGEMNHYPLPDHALKYKEQIGLNSGQVTKLKALAAGLHRKKVEMGENIIRNEKMLDSLFHTKQVIDGTLIFYANRSGLYFGELKGAILMACYQTEKILSDDQIRKLEALEKKN